MSWDFSLMNTFNMEVMNYANTYLIVTLCDKAIKVNIALKSMVLLAMCSYVNIYMIIAW
jgi:hypothetical protein